MLSANPRYALLNEQIFAARGEDLHLAIDGVERLSVYADTIAPEAACTSVQLHQLVDPDAFARHWNAAQCIAGIQLAVGANSPFFFGRELWRETRIALFEQATDTRSEELKAQGVRPRVWFGERWITSIFDLFEENVRYFPSLLPVVEEEEPVEVLERGDTPRLQELRLHNGTIYRWNRPIYDVVRGRPHLRVENRVLPAGPTVVDTLANAAFYYGLVRVLADEDRPLWTQMSFSAAEENFHACARDGIDGARLLARPRRGAGGRAGASGACCRWRTRGSTAGASTPADRDRLLGIVERRCVEGRNGAQWQADTFHRLYEHADRARRAARDDRALPRAHAHQRAGPHLARPPDRFANGRAGHTRAMRIDSCSPHSSASCSFPTVRDRRPERFSGCVAESVGCTHKFTSGSAPLVQLQGPPGGEHALPGVREGQDQPALLEPHDRGRRPLASGVPVTQRPRLRQAHRALVRGRQRGRALAVQARLRRATDAVLAHRRRRRRLRLAATSRPTTTGRR